MSVITNFFKAVRRLFLRDEAKKAINKEPAVSSAMYEKLRVWADMYAGNAEWTTDYVKSLRLERSICRELANTCMTEMTAKATNKAVDKPFQKAIQDLNEHLQEGLAYGSFCIKPLIDGTVEYINADRFIPLRFDSKRRMTAVSFVSCAKVGSNYYRRYETHDLTSNGLTISNVAFKSKAENSIGEQCQLSEVDEWKNIAPGPLTYAIDRPDFGYFRTPLPNSIDKSACGVSIYEPAEDNIRDADEQYARIKWEFESGERAVDVDVTALRPINGGGNNGFKAPKLNERLFRGLNIDGGTAKGELYEVYSPVLRDVSHINGLNAILRRIEFNCSLAYGDLSDVQDVSKTATEMKIAKKRKYDMVNAIEENLRECLEDLVFALSFYLGLTYTNASLDCVYDDSVMRDEEAERKQDMSDVAIGAMTLLEYRMKWYNETEEEAKKKIVIRAEVIE